MRLLEGEGEGEGEEGELNIVDYIMIMELASSHP